MKVENFTETDLPVLTALQPTGWPDIFPHFEFYVSSPFCHPYKFVSDGMIVGIGASILHLDVAWLAHIIVHSGQRNKGFGRFITDFLVKSLENTICKTIYLIATDLGSPVYSKAGFVTETEYLFFKDIKIQQNIQEDYIRPMTDEFRRSLFRLDNQASGEIRDMAAGPHLSSCLTYVKDDQLHGFYLPTFGEGLIIARDPSAGLELMKLRLAANSNACFPKDNVNGKEFLYKNDYKEFRAAKRMRLGQERKWHPDWMYNRIGGNLG